MDTLEIFSVASSIFSVALAIFAIWFANLQRVESSQNYENTKTVLAEITKVLEKTQLLVSENFQNLLNSVTDQQAKMLDSLKPRPTQEEKMSDLIIKLADEPEKLERVGELLVRVSAAQQQTAQAADPWSMILQAAMQQQQQQQGKK